MLLPRINELSLEGADKMTHLWNQGSPSITFLQILKLFEFSNIGGYEMVREVIATDGATYHETNFKEL
ncbi:hypothetical protein CXB51_028658 [Gossypium anomalum]|uniref:Uncharacterized protein n=1 Tax=Gossypium anomalum TaxID=47600 RepID=A0A8J5YCS9_9ROSI|nr:hypothetical protein CXB51_028658 [Gossypium anomalum]